MREDEFMLSPTSGRFSSQGNQYMDLAGRACPPDSYVWNNMAMDLAETKYTSQNAAD